MTRSDMRNAFEASEHCFDSSRDEIGYIDADTDKAACLWADAWRAAKSSPKLTAAVNHAISEALAGASEPRKNPKPGDDKWDDGYINGIKACGTVVQAAMHFALTEPK